MCKISCNGLFIQSYVCHFFFIDFENILSSICFLNIELRTNKKEETISTKRGNNLFLFFLCDDENVFFMPPPQTQKKLKKKRDLFFIRAFTVIFLLVGQKKINLEMQKKYFCTAAFGHFLETILV